MVSIIALILFICLIIGSFIYNRQFPKHMKKKNMTEFHQGNLTKDRLVKRTLLRLFVPGSEIPIVMLLLMIVKQFHFNHAHLVYTSFGISITITLLMFVLGFYYYKKEAHNVYQYEHVFVRHDYDIQATIASIEHSNDQDLIHANARMNELMKTSLTQGTLQTVVCVMFLLSL